MTVSSASRLLWEHPTILDDDFVTPGYPYEINLGFHWRQQVLRDLESLRELGDHCNRMNIYARNVVYFDTALSYEENENFMFQVETFLEFQEGLPHEDYVLLLELHDVTPNRDTVDDRNYERSENIRQ